MAKLERFLQKIFGETGSTTQFGKIGSEAAGLPATTKDLAEIQSLSQYLSGLFGITASGAEPPRIQDINALYFLITSQLRYLFQNGIPEWQTDTDYYADVSYVQVNGTIYQALTGTTPSPNQGNDPTSSPTDWKSTITIDELTLSTLNVTGIVMGTGSADRNIQFASDANILWDESADRFKFDKDVECTGINMSIGAGTDDRRIRFANDTSIFWDESQNQIEFDKNISLGTSSVDANIQFAGDASIFWDESLNRFVLNKRIEINSELIIGTGSADSNIQFANDASIFWDESDDQFEFNKNVAIDQINGNSNGAVSINKIVTTDDVQIPALTTEDLAYGILLSLVDTITGKRIAVNGYFDANMYPILNIQWVSGSPNKIVITYTTTPTSTTTLDIREGDGTQVGFNFILSVIGLE